MLDTAFGQEHDRIKTNTLQPNCNTLYRAHLSHFTTKSGKPLRSAFYSPANLHPRFELSDAMIPGQGLIALQPVPSTQKTMTEGTTLSGLSQFLEPQKQKFYYPQKEQIQYIQQEPSSEPQYVQENEIQNPTPRPEVHYTQSTPSPSSRPATLQQHYEDRQTYYPEIKPTPQIEYVPVTDIETGPQQMPQQYHYEANRPTQQPQYEENRQTQQPQYEGSRPTQQPHIQYIIETENARQPPPRPQVHYASDNGDLRASAQPQYERPSPRPQINYPSESTILRGSTQYVQDTNEVTPTPQYEPESVRTTPHAQYDHEHNDVTTPQPQYQYVTEDVTPTPHVEVPISHSKFVDDFLSVFSWRTHHPSSRQPFKKRTTFLNRRINCLRI